mmetsp:Transcript_152088/g.276606  ORF Transcript_152088/g.276606 Transcript_152088/m.276606 type:complete len:557 (-) Transcript_152088:56-1726(-)
MSDFSDEEVDYSRLSVQQLKARIKKAGYSFADCTDKADLRQRAKQADAAKASGIDLPNLPKEGLHKRANAKVSREEEENMIEKAAALATESTKVMGSRDASVILAEARELREKIEGMSMTASGKQAALNSLGEAEKGLAFEDALEKNCSRIIQVAMLAMAIIPMFLTSLENAYEYSTRPAMIVEPNDLSNMNAVITGGCGAVGVELAIMFAQAGAGVTIGCHGSKLSEEDKVRARLAQEGLLRSSSMRGFESDRGWIEMWPLRLESFDSVREFAARVAQERGSLDILVHNAATKEGCTRTADGYELATQVNYLSPFLLTHLLLPTFQEGSRVVHVTCDAALQQPDWLPWPFRRTQADLLPYVNVDGLSKRKEIAGSCSPLMEYANAKLAILLHSQQLNRRLADIEKPGISYAVNPGAMDSAFGRSDSVPTKPSMRNSMMGSLPPVWIAQKIYQFTLGKALSSLGTFMLRPVDVGAKAIFHVATSPSLFDQESGGALFSDKAGAFTNCGKSPEECGRVQLHLLPAAVADLELAEELWSRTESAIGQKSLQSVSPSKK